MLSAFLSATFPMVEPFFMRWKLDRPCVEAGKSEDLHVLFRIEPNPALLRDAGAGHVPVHLLLLVDVSESMNILIRPDPQARTLRSKTTEGIASEEVVSEVPSRRETACSVVRKIVDRLQPDDWITLVAFDDQPYVLTHSTPAANRAVLAAAVDRLGKVGGGGTALGQGMQAVRDVLAAVSDAPRHRKLVLLTDGEANDPERALSEAQLLGRDLNVPIVAFGTGECKVAFLTNVAKTTLAGGFNHIRSESDAEQLFFQVLTGQQNIQASNVSLKLWLSPEIQVRELYRTRPEILFVGDLQPDAHQMVTLRLEQMERGKAYEFLFRCTLPARSSHQRFRIAKATLEFQLTSDPANLHHLESNVVVEYTDDVARLGERSGDVKRVLARAEVQRQVLFLQHKIDLLAANQANDRDRAIVAKLLEALLAKFRDFGDQAMVNQYAAMRDEFQRNGSISQEMLNRSLAASSRAEEVMVAQDIDF